MTEHVVIVGGGIVGCATAYFCAREGLPVTLLERKSIGYGASGRNPGFLWLHCRTAGFALEMSRAGRAMVPRLQEELPGGFEYRACGGLIYFTTPDQGAVFSEFVATRQRDGLEIELVDAAVVRRLVPGIRDDVLGASYCAEDAQIATPTLLAALVRGARAEGVEIREGVEVRGFVDTGGEVAGVDTDAGTIACSAVVVAAGAWTTPLLAACGVELPIGVERLQLLRTSAVPFHIEPLVYGPLAARQYALFRDLPSWDDRHFTSDLEQDDLLLLPLCVQQASGELLLGCATDYPDDLDPHPTLAGLALVTAGMRVELPNLADAIVIDTWAGALPFTSDQRPVIDEVMPGLFVGAGHAFGNTTGLVTGRVLSRLVAGREPEFDVESCRLDRPLASIAAGASTQW